ncbi:unnamed protein product [Lactuca saligna]|uniref:Uncharacterized protein n=1 Tax=Lactuca saligna TaxID=75948 RepID=A0AA35VQ17_LACSI|nr:unnamed protein product [Lactuca saligna]
MGACLSSAGDSVHNSSSAFVISVDGDLCSYPTPIFVSEVLRFEKSSTFFLCNSDDLYYDQYINALDLEYQLDAAQIYFILPKTMLGRRLSASDMAALAVKASLALDSNSNADSHKRNNNKARISPLVLMETTGANENKNVGSLRMSSSRSIRKLSKRSSKKARLGVGSFRLVLSTIYENDGCDELQMI